VGGGFFADYLACATVQDDPSLKRSFFRLAEEARPQVILLEHPWLWPMVQKIPGVMEGRIPVVYDSQNVEARLKHRMVQHAQLTRKVRDEAEALLPVVERFEQDVVTNVAAVTACTKEDAAVFTAWGARRTVVAGNGSSRRPTTGLRRLLPAVLPDDCRYALMVGSEHLPNVTGFENLVLPWLPLLRPGQRVVAAGGASDWIGRRLAECGASWAVQGRLVLLGRVNDLTLSALIENAACLMLPIEFGGGSNIKTAEALLSGRAIVASPTSMRGFEEYRAVPGLTIADGPDAFGDAVRAALTCQSTTMRSPESVAALTWDAMLTPLLALVDDLVPSPSRMIVNMPHETAPGSRTYEPRHS
jgi:hypothetical protein